MTTLSVLEFCFEGEKMNTFKNIVSSTRWMLLSLALIAFLAAGCQASIQPTVSAPPTPTPSARYPQRRRPLRRHQVPRQQPRRQRYRNIRCHQGRGHMTSRRPQTAQSGIRRNVPANSGGSIRARAKRTISNSVKVQHRTGSSSDLMARPGSPIAG